jgi:mannose/cellobiose epimerase-like protein (N-acyl-D-glucosamine 2-epimerase family)
LLQLNRHAPEVWLVEKAKSLFNRSFDKSCDHDNDGLIYGFDPDGNWCDDDKYFWVQAESLAAAALLYQFTDDEQYLDRYNDLWLYC